MWGYEQLSMNLRGIMGHQVSYLVQASPCLPHVPIPHDSFEQLVSTWPDDVYQAVRPDCCPEFQTFPMLYMGHFLLHGLLAALHLPWLVATCCGLPQVSTCCIH